VEFEVDNTNAVSYGWSRGVKRIGKWYYSEAIMEGTDVLVVKKGTSFSWRNYAELQPYTIGTVRGYGLPDGMHAIEDTLQLRVAGSDEMNLRKMLRGRVDLIIINPLVGADILRSKFSANDRSYFKFMLDKHLVSYTLHVVCSKHNDDCAEMILRFNEGLNILTREGLKQKIIDQAMSFECELAPLE